MRQWFKAWALNRKLAIKNAWEEMIFGIKNAHKTSKKITDEFFGVNKK